MRAWRGVIESAAMLTTMVLLAVGAASESERTAWTLGGIYWMIRFCQETLA